MEKKELETQLWSIAKKLRGKMYADEYKNYILGFIFYKFLSEIIDFKANGSLENDNIKFIDLDIENNDLHKQYLEALRTEAVDEMGFFIEPSQLFHTLVSRDNSFLIEDLTNIFNLIERSTFGTDSEDDFRGLFEDVDLTSSKLGKTPDDKNELILSIMKEIDKIDFDIHNPDVDILGDAYEYLISQFAAEAGKGKGEFYTPQSVSTLLSKVVSFGKRRLRSVYDPTCGSGSLLLSVAKEVESVDNFYGQELNPTTYNLARMNMILHNVNYRDFDIKNADTLFEPQHTDMTFEAIVANPPFSHDWQPKAEMIDDDRFSEYGVLAPKTKADFAFVQHMIHHLDDNGTMAAVFPHGVLFRSGAEAKIRKYLIEENNYLDCVIGLPEDIFFGTSIPTCILIFKKCRTSDDDILFIDASKEFEKEKKNILTPDNINAIFEAYSTRRSYEKFSEVVSLETIKENDYNLNIPRYVDTFEEEAVIDLDEVSSSLSELNSEIEKTDKNIGSFCDELNIAKPF